MARFETSGLDELMQQLRKMGQQSGDIAKAMILTGADEIKQAWQDSAEAHGLRDTGAMIESVAYDDEPRELGGALAVDIWPRGKDASGTRNAEKAFILNYGSSRIQATHWVDDAERAAEAAIVPAMEEVLDEYLRTGQIPTLNLSSNKSRGRRGASKKTT